MAKYDQVSDDIFENDDLNDTSESKQDDGEVLFDSKLQVEDEDFSSEQGEYPVLPLRDMVIMPGTVAPLFVGRPSSIKAVEDALASHAGMIFLTAQLNPDLENPNVEDIFEVGCLGKILQVLSVPEEEKDTLKVLVEGRMRATMAGCLQTEPYMIADVDIQPKNEMTIDPKTHTLTRSLLSQFEEYVALNKKLPSEILSAMSAIRELGKLVDGIVSHSPLLFEDKQMLLEEDDIALRAEALIALLESEINMLTIDKKIHQRVKRQMDNTQLKYFLTEKLSAVQDELKEIDGSDSTEIGQLEEKIKTVGLSPEATEKAKGEIEKLKMMSPMSSEATVVRHYLDWLLGLPWSSKSKINKNLNKAEEVLNQDHFGLEKVKERILEYLAVDQMSKRAKGPILCLVGPPGVGKTSLGESIAKATNRAFVRLSLGGVRDESEIRGHRKTYIGAMPGKIIQKLVRCKKNNPLFMLDEIDKMGMDFRGDPASALLEVLDPSQNHNFNDHYLEVDFDLSGTMFIATANSLDVPHALRDRMEIIHLTGYTEKEKRVIAEKYLIDKAKKDAGLKVDELHFSDCAVLHMIRHYTHEAGVRELERCIAKVARKMILKIVREMKANKSNAMKAETPSDKPPAIDPLVKISNIEDFLGVMRYDFDKVGKQDQIGQVTGLAWTELGGDILTLETAIVPGKGDINCTGSLGEVMQESIQAALTVIKSRMHQFNLTAKDFETHDVHVHVPEGATPKDGPSAGIGMSVALASAYSRIPVRSGIAMTGEITLRGEVLPIGGLKEKLLAALRSGVKHVIIPKDNEKDLKEVPDDVTQALKISPVSKVDEVFALALSHWPLTSTNAESKTPEQVIAPVTSKKPDKEAAEAIC